MSSVAQGLGHVGARRAEATGRDLFLTGWDALGLPACCGLGLRLLNLPNFLPDSVQTMDRNGPSPKLRGNSQLLEVMYIYVSMSTILDFFCSIRCIVWNGAHAACVLRSGSIRKRYVEDRCACHVVLIVRLPWTRP